MGEALKDRLLCDGCGQEATRSTYVTEGPWAGKWLCRECNRRRWGLKRLSVAVHYGFNAAELLPPSDPMTVPLVRLMMSVDDMRRAQDQLLAATARLERVPEFEKYLPLGDHLYAMRLLYSHLHEAGRALRALDTAAKKRVDALIAQKPESQEILSALRVFFNASDYETSFLSRMRNAIGFHYDHAEVMALVQTHFKPGVVGQAVAAEFGGLGRMADVLLLTALDELAGGDLLTGGDTASRVLREANILVVKLTRFVDHLFESLLAQRPAALVEQHEGVVGIPPHLRRQRGVVENEGGHEEAIGAPHWPGVEASPEPGHMWTTRREAEKALEGPLRPFGRLLQEAFSLIDETVLKLQEIDPPFGVVCALVLVKGAISRSAAIASRWMRWRRRQALYFDRLSNPSNS
jgi:hypothetical protein